MLRATWTQSRQKHDFRSWLNSRQREIEARKWGHTDTARFIVCAPTWDCGGGRQLPRSGITDVQLSSIISRIQRGLLKFLISNGQKGGAQLLIIAN